MSLKRKHSPDPLEAKSDADTDLFRSAPVEDRSSTFIGFYSPSLKPKDLQNIAEIASASHKMLAWRRESNQQSINKAKQYISGSDDDGEKYGGKRIEKVLNSTRVTGACVVARWYGGVLLGPVRFEHIETCALEAITQAETHAKKRKLEAEEKVKEEGDRKRLCETLVERDNSIMVLRAMAQDKEIMVKEASCPGKSSDSISSATPAAKTESKSATPMYTSMPLLSLKSLEKARDATLSFLLKRIDDAETKLKRAQGSKEPP